MGLICKIFKHKWKIIDEGTPSTRTVQCKRCKTTIVRKQYLGTAMVTIFDKNMNLISEEIMVTRGDNSGI